MPAPRFIDWSHIKVVGDDLGAAAPYVNEARKLMGYVQEDAARQGLGVHSMRRELEDGTVIIAEKHGDIPRMTIAPAPARPTLPPPVVRDDFVVWARTTELPDGIDEDRPQQILRPAWTTFFDNADIEGFEDFDGEKGTYGGMFPRGLLLAGNIDWRRAETGERISWYGPSSRYWYDDWRQPRAQYGKHIFHLGQVLLDVEDYCANMDEPFDERYVLGAAMTAASLLVVMADLPESLTWPPPPGTAANTPDSWSTPSLPLDNIPVVLRRFALVHDAGLVDPMQYTVPSNSHHDLWSGAVARGASPWHFDESASIAVTHVPPAGLEFTQRGATVVHPSGSHQRLVLDIGGSSATLSTAAVSLPAGPYNGDDAVLAEDGERALRLVRKAHAGFGAALFYRMEGHDYLAMGVTEPPSVLSYERRQIVWADLRAGVMLLVKDAISFGEFVYHLAYILCADGVETEIWADSTPVVAAPAYDAVRTVLLSTNERSTAPLAWAHLNAFGMMEDGWAGGVHNAQCSLTNAHYMVPFRTADVLGQTAFAFSAGSWTNTQLKTAVARNTGANTQVDGLGHTTLPGFATYEGYSIFSHSTNAAINGQRVVLNHITASTLAETTGVAGAVTVENGTSGYDARYHPIWLLGARRPTT